MAGETVEKQRNAHSTYAAKGLLMAGVMLLSVFSTGTSSAKPRPTGSERCWVTPNPVGIGLPYTVSGCGFKPGRALDIRIGEEGLRTAVVDPSGNLVSPEWAQFDSSGSKRVTVYDMMDRRKRSALASCSFEVYP